MRVRGRSALLLAAVAAVVVASVVVVRRFRDEAKPAPVAEIVTGFRHEKTARIGAEPRLVPGVYVYATKGFEKIDALGGARHEYPPQTTITITGGGCGVKLRWVALEHRSTTWERCVRPRGYLLRGSYETHRFFGSTEHTDYLCTSTPERPNGDRPGTTWPFRCGTKGIRQTGMGRVIARETLTLAGTRVETVHVASRTRLAGETRGTSAQDAWLERSTGLPVRLVMTSETSTGSLVGDVHYQERVELTLTSPRPRR